MLMLTLQVGAAFGILSCIAFIVDYTSKARRRVADRGGIFQCMRDAGGLGAREFVIASRRSVLVALELVYGRKLFSWRSVLASIITSSFAVAICAILFARIWPDDPFAEFRQQQDKFLKWYLVNLVVDFISLMQTRYTMRRSVSTPRLPQLAYSLFDIFFSLAIYVLVILVCYRLIFPHFGGAGDFGMFTWSDIEREVKILLQIPTGTGFADAEGKSLLSVFGWSTLFTSFIFQAFLLVSLLLRLSGGIFQRVVAILAGEERKGFPLLAAAQVLGVISTLLCAIYDFLDAAVS